RQPDHAGRLSSGEFRNRHPPASGTADEPGGYLPSSYRKAGELMNSVFIRQMRAEKLKARNKKAVLVPLGFLAFDFLWSIWQVSSMDPGELPVGYMMFFYQLPTMNVILLPLMISVIASRICDMEVKGDTMKLLFTLQK